MLKKLWVFTLSGLLVSCSQPSNPDLNGEVLSSDTPELVDGVVMLQQNWNAAERDAFHRTTEGGALLPVMWLKALELPDSEQLLNSKETFALVGLIEDPGQPDGLPIGLAKTQMQGMDMVGFTCASCHTTEISFRGSVVRVEGGGATFDSPTYGRYLLGSVVQTLKNEEKFDRFAKRLVPPEVANDAAMFAVAKEQIKAAMQPVAAAFEAGLAAEQALQLAPLREGHGRLDAMSRVANNTLLAMDVGNAMPALAPVSTPPLWDSQRLDWRHVSGSIRQSMGRDIINAVSGGASFAADGSSAAAVPELRAIEKLVDKLKAPKWPANVFGKINKTRAERGEKLFEQHCVSCHAPAPEAGEIVQTMVPLDEIGTDPAAATVIAQKTVNASALSLGVVPYFSALQSLSNLLKAKKYNELSLTPEQQLEWDDGRENIWRTPLAYKARPLNGIWATAPYLHNGSVPSLEDLLLPPAERPESFYLGAHQEFDPVRVGYVSKAASDGSSFLLDTRLAGNRNTGHTYGTTLSKSERRALVEYMKTLH